jgi:hypothetical protein
MRYSVEIVILVWYIITVAVWIFVIITKIKEQRRRKKIFKNSDIVRLINNVCGIVENMHAELPCGVKKIKYDKSGNAVIKTDKNGVHICVGYYILFDDDYIDNLRNYNITDNKKIKSDKTETIK